MLRQAVQAGEAMQSPSRRAMDIVITEGRGRATDARANIIAEVCDEGQVL